MTDPAFPQNPDIQSNMIIPVVLAGGSNLQFWPRSRLNMPLQFQRKIREPSPFEKVMRELTKFPNTLPPIVMLPSTSLEIAQAQMKAQRTDEQSIVCVEPVERGTLGAAVAAALLAARVNRHALMMIIDPAASDLATGLDWDALRRIAGQTNESTQARDTIIACGEPTSISSGHSGMVMKGRRTTDLNLSEIARDTGDNYSSRFKIGAITFTTPRTFLDRIEETAPHILACCSRAMNICDEHRGLVWPDINLWSAQPQTSLVSMLTQQDAHVLLRPANLQRIVSKRQHSSPDCFEIDTVNCSLSAQGHLLVVAGCENLDVVSTHDATLITPAGEPERAAPLLAQLRQFERPEISDFPSRFSTWGAEHQIDAGNGFSVHKLVIEPNVPLETQSHDHRAEHWHVLSGHGEATIGSRRHVLRPGMSLDIPRCTNHGCINLAARPLIILETRHGAILSSFDKQVEPAPLERSFS